MVWNFLTLTRNVKLQEKLESRWIVTSFGIVGLQDLSEGENKACCEDGQQGVNREELTGIVQGWCSLRKPVGTWETLSFKGNRPYLFPYPRARVIKLFSHIPRKLLYAVTLQHILKNISVSQTMRRKMLIEIAMSGKNPWALWQCEGILSVHLVNPI